MILKAQSQFSNVKNRPSNQTEVSTSFFISASNGFAVLFHNLYFFQKCVILIVYKWDKIRESISYEGGQFVKNRKINVAIGFATGRKHFQRVLRNYVFNWLESNLTSNEKVGLNLYVAYDLDYRGTKRTDYTRINPEISQYLDHTSFIGKQEVDATKQSLVNAGTVSMEEANMLFGRGYAAQRNIILYSAMRDQMDCLLFLDDDEYPIAATKNRDMVIWGGQHVLKAHLQSIKDADITYGYHCGYISPIPYIEFNDDLTEDRFRQFIQAISNDIVNWDSIRQVMNHGGVTYADTDVLIDRKTLEVPEINHAKFISGSNLCINLTHTNRVFPFYNPPGARGEDTFLGTCLSRRKVVRVPCYTFHDGFSAYNHLLSGVLPTSLKFIKPDSEQIIQRFYHACIGWIRYKPLLMYITDRDNYRTEISDMTKRLNETLPAICRYFGTQAFMNILKELKKYDRAVEKHFCAFEGAKQAWAKVMEELS